MGTNIFITEALFSKTQRLVLALLYGHPERSYYLKEIFDRVNIGRGTVQRELEKFVRAGLITLNPKGNQKHYQANKDCSIYAELISIVRKTLKATVNDTTQGKVIIADQVVVSRERLELLLQRNHIIRLVLFGSAARGELESESDIDLLVTFAEGEAPSLGHMVALQDEFSLLFGGRKVDVATPAILNNPYRRRTIEKDMEILYAA